MKRTTLHRTAGLAALVLTASLSLSACGSDEPDAADDTTTSESSAPMDEETPEETPMEEESDDMGDADPAAQTFGPACGEVPADGAGSFVGMATEPVANAASANPLLSTLVAAVTAADLVDTLNSADGITVFAPANPAFDAFSKKQLNGLLKDKETLTKVLTHHVVAGQLSPDDLAGEHETLAGDMLTVEGEGEDFTVGTEGAAVLCGNVPTANATVYIIDTVLMPS
ncbi:fasciclin domain-containing protein [Nocardioides bigeumensis]|uniref:Fasciclin domain-containing protein n=1 Tax=Nocardioides bigeumensis TaxID=433657 RepID=A0ABN2YXG3_9ACTN